MFKNFKKTSLQSKVDTLSKFYQLQSLSNLSPNNSISCSSPLSSSSNFDNFFNSENFKNSIEHSYDLHQKFQIYNNFNLPQNLIKVSQNDICYNIDDLNEFDKEKLEEEEASKSLIDQMQYENNIQNKSSYKNEKLKIEKTVKNDYRYIVKISNLKPNQYKQNSQVQNQSFVKIPKFSGITNVMLRSSRTSSDCLPYSSSLNNSHQQSNHTTVNTTLVPYITSSAQQSSYNIRNVYQNSIASNSTTTIAYNNALNIMPNTSLHSMQQDYNFDSLNYQDDIDNAYTNDYSNEINDNLYTEKNQQHNGNEAICAVCGDGHAKLHYGVLACYGCKGFFRRTLTGKYRYVCRFGNNCVVDKYQRNSCRFCRFNRCLEVGMDPKAVRPDRDITGKQRVPRARKRHIDEELINHFMRLQGDDWSRKIPVEAKVLLMQLLNIESKILKGEVTQKEPFSSIKFSKNQSEISNNIKINDNSNLKEKIYSLRELFEQKPALNIKTKMCYKPYRMARPEELSQIVYRSAIAAVDWVESLADIGDFCSTEDKIALVKASYAPLTIFSFSAQTAQKTKDPNILCLCSYSYVPRKLPTSFNTTNHLSNALIDQTLNELVSPLRKLNLKEEEVVPLKSIIILNPNAKGLSLSAQQHIAELRDKIQEMLFQIVKEMYPAYNASSRFGNLLLLLPTITMLSGVMNKNIQLNSISNSESKIEALLNELFEKTSFKTNSSFDEFLITSSTSLPLLENPADISLQSTTSTNCNLTQKNSRNYNQIVEKVDEYTQTDNSNISTNSLFHCTNTEDNNQLTLDTNTIDDYDPFSDVIGFDSFGSSFDECSLLEDCDLTESTTFLPKAAAELFESNADLFALMP